MTDHFDAAFIVYATMLFFKFKLSYLRITNFFRGIVIFTIVNPEHSRSISKEGFCGKDELRNVMLPAFSLKVSKIIIFYTVST